MKSFYFTLGLLAIIFWGVSLAASKILLENGFPPNFITFCRFFIAFLLIRIFFPSTIRGKIERKDRLYFLIMGLGGTALFFFFENTGLKYTTVGNTSLITATIPLFTLFTAFLFLKKKIHWQNLLGIMLGLTGTSILFYRDLIGSSLHLKGDLLILGSVWMWVIYSFAFRKISGKYKAIFIVDRTFLFGLLFLLPTLVVDLERIISLNVNVQIIVSILFLAVFCSFLGYYFWNLALLNVGVKVTSNLILFIPIVSIIAGVIILKEQLQIQVYLATPLIMLGAYLTSLSTVGNEF